MEDDDDFGDLYENAGAQDRSEADEDELDYDDREYASLPVSGLDDDDEFEEEEMLYGTPVPPPVVKATTIPPPPAPSEMPTKSAAVGSKVIKETSKPAVEDDEGEDDIYAQLYGEGPSTATADASPPLPSRTSEASSYFGTSKESLPDLFWPTKTAGTVRNQELPSLPNNIGKLLQNETASIGKFHGSNIHSTIATVLISGSHSREAKDGGIAHITGDMHSGSLTGRIESGEAYKEHPQGAIGRNIPVGDIRDGSEGAVTSQTRETYEKMVAGEELQKDAKGDVEKDEFRNKSSTPEIEQLKAIMPSSMDIHTGMDLVLDEGSKRAVDVVAPAFRETADGHTEAGSNSGATMGIVENAIGKTDTVFLFPSRDVTVPDSAAEAVVSEADQNKAKTVENGVLVSAEKHGPTDALDTGDTSFAEEDRDKSQDFGIIVDSDKGGHDGRVEGGNRRNAEGEEDIKATDDMPFAEEGAEQEEENAMDWNHEWNAKNALPNREGDAGDNFDDSGSEDDLEIVLNEEPPFPYMGRTLPHQVIHQQHLHSAVQSLPDRVKDGVLHEDDDVDEDSDDDDDLVIVANEPMTPGEEAWTRTQPLGEAGGGATPVGASLEDEAGIVGQGGAEQNSGLPQRASGAPGLTPLGPRSNLSGVRIPGQHGPSIHMKYVRPGVVADGNFAATAAPGGTPNGVASGAIGEATQGAMVARAGQPSGAGRGEWGWNSMQQRYAWAEPVREFMLPSNKSLFDVNIEELEDKPWRRPGADLSDYFNFDLNENSWQDYCRQLAQLKEEAAGSKIRVYESNREQEYDPELPPELAAASGNPERGGPLGDGTGRGRGGQLPGRAIQVDGGFGGERRPSHELRRHRPYDPDVIIEIKLLDLDEYGNPLPEQTSDVGEDKNAVKEKQELEAVQEQMAAMAEDTGESRLKEFSQREDMQYSHAMRPRQSTPHRGMGRPTWPGGEEGPPNAMWERMNAPLMTGPGLRRGGPMRGNAPLGPGPGLGMGPMSGMGPGSMGLPSASMGPGPPLTQMGPLYPPPMSMANRIPGPGSFGVRPLSSAPRPPMRPGMGLDETLSPFGSPPEYHGGRAVEGARQMSPPPPSMPSRRGPPPTVRSSKRGGISDDETKPSEALASKRSAQESEEESEDDEDDEDEDDEDDDDDDDEEEELERDRARRDLVQRRHVMKERQEELLRPKAWELSPPQSLSDDSRSRRRGGEWIQEENNIAIEGKDRRKPEDRTLSRSAQMDQSVRRTSVREEESSRSRRMPERSARDDERPVPLRERETTRGGRGWSDPEWKELGRSSHSQINAVSAVHGGRGAMRGERGQTVEAERRQDRNSWEEPMNVLPPRKVMDRQGRREDGSREKKRGHERDEEAMVRMDRSLRYSADGRADGRPISDRPHVEGGRGSRGETRAPTRKRVGEEGRWEEDRPREQWRLDGSTRPLETSERSRRAEKDKKRDTVHDRLGARQADFPDDRNAERPRHWDRDRERERPGARERSKTRDSRTSEWEQTRSKKRRGEDWGRDGEPARSHRSDEHTDRGDLRGQLASGDDRPRKEKRGNEDGVEDYERGNGGGSNPIAGQRQANGVSGSKRRTTTEEVASVDPSVKTKRRRSDEHGEPDSSSHATDRKDDHEPNTNGRRTKERSSGAREGVGGEQEELRGPDVASVTGRVGRSRYERWKSVKIVEEDKDIANNAISTVITDIAKTEVQEHIVEQEGDGGQFQKELDRGRLEVDKETSSKYSERQKSAENAHVKEGSPLEGEAQLVNQSSQAERMHKRDKRDEVLETREYESVQKGDREVRHGSSSKEAKMGSGRNREESRFQDMHAHQVSRGKKDRAGGSLLDESEEIRKRRRERFGPIDEGVAAKETPSQPHGEEIKADRPPRKRRWA